MRSPTAMRFTSFVLVASLVTACGGSPVGPADVAPRLSGGSGGGGGGTTNPPKVDDIKVTKCYTNGGGAMLIKAASSDPTATLTAYRPDGSVIGNLQNGGGSRYGGTVMPYQAYDPGTVTIRSSAGGSITVPTSPFQI